MNLIWDDFETFFSFVLQTLYLFVVLYAPSLALEAGKTLTKFSAEPCLQLHTKICIVEISVSYGRDYTNFGIFATKWTVGID